MIKSRRVFNTDDLSRIGFPINKDKKGDPGNAVLELIIMANDYRLEQENKDKAKISDLLATLPPYVSLYVNHINFSTTPKTRLEYVRDIDSFLTYLFNTDEETYKSKKDIPIKRLNSLKLDHFNEYLNYLTMYKKNGQIRANSNVSVRRKLSSLRSFFNYLFINDMIDSNQIQKVKIPALKKKNIIRMDGDEVSDFMSAVEYGSGKMSEKQRAYFDKYAPRDTAIVTLLLNTGIRVSELVGLDIKDIDFKRCGIKIIRKGGKEDIVYFNDETKEVLESYIEYRKNIEEIEGNENALFLSSRRSRITVRSVEILVKKYANASAIVKKITPHKLRSTYGTDLYESTSDIGLVAEVLGHESVQTTRKFYTEISDKHKFENRNAVKRKN